MPALSTTHINRQLKNVPLWSKRGKTIYRKFNCGKFPLSISFVNKIAIKAQKINHHPDIDIRFDKVTLTLTTHDEGGITEKDFTLALRCDKVFTALL